MNFACTRRRTCGVRMGVVVTLAWDEIGLSAGHAIVCSFETEKYQYSKEETYSIEPTWEAVENTGPKQGTILASTVSNLLETVRTAEVQTRLCLERSQSWIY